MSKSNADFSAFDFNDSSDNSDIQTRPPFLSRAGLNNSSNHNSNSNAHNSNNNNNNNNNSSNNNNNTNSISNNNNNGHHHQRHHSGSSCSNGNGDTTTGNTNDDSQNALGSADEDDGDEDDDDEEDDEHVADSATCARHDERNQAARHEAAAALAAAINSHSRSRSQSQHSHSSSHSSGSSSSNSSSHSHSSQHQQPSSNIACTNSNDNLRNAAASNGGATAAAAAAALTAAAAAAAAINHSNADALLMCSGGNSNNVGGAVGGAPLGAASAGLGADANTMSGGAAGAAANAAETNSNCAVTGLLDSTGLGGGSNNCNELVRSSSASLSNISNAVGSVAGGAAGGAAGHNDRKKYRHQNYSKNIYIGTKNAEKWEHTRTRLQFKNDVEFVAYLLNLADNDTDRLANLPPPSASNTPTKSFSSNFKLEPNLSAKEFSNTPIDALTDTPPSGPGRKKSKKRVQFSDTLNGFPKMKDFSNFAVKAKKHDAKMKSANGGTSDTLPEVLDCRIAEKIKSELEEKSATKEAHPSALCLKKRGNAFAHASDVEDDDETDAAGTSGAATKVAGDTVSEVGSSITQNSNFRVRVKSKRGPKGGGGSGSGNMVPPANTLGSMSTAAGDEEDDDGEGESDGDDDDEEMDEEAMAREMKNEQNFVEEEDEHDIAFRSQQSCRECSITHDYKVCPLRTAIGTITDAVDLAEWIERKNLEALAKLKADAQRQAKQDHDDEDMDETSQMSELETKHPITFAEASVPAEFELHNVEPNVTGVFARTEVRAYTKLGPLIGQRVESNDVREGSDMKWIFEICEAGADKSQLLCCDNPNTSNWLRYIRPAPSYDERNVNLVSIERQAYFVTCREVKNGMELLYWSDDCNTMWRKKHTEKTNCGGCNLKFDHPLYYRTHCSIFHDPSMSLTIRKYHCKVCGEAVLGKDNIMKHAAEMHDGKGAYQCQFCNKFFLRLNYLEMHRTYGCAANPNRARPLCDFCGRKFCQPQKLKAHIKRMHSGSRAALQRHSKEVHSRNSTVVSCPRCQKLFQNRSNLKIHMLTHSGVRPFKCAEPECNAAFTTKQCLQFHYKKVHNYTQEQMPKIERSVAYTFDAYSGGMKVDFLEQAPRRRRKSMEDQNSMLSSSIQSDTEFSDDNIFEAIKKSGKSIKDLCRNEPNLSLLSSKISSIFGEKVVGSRKRKKKKEPPTPSLLNANDDDDEEDRLEQVRRKQNAQLSLVESFLTTTAQRLTAQQQVQQVVAAAAAVSAMAGGAAEDPSKIHMMSGLNAQHHMGMGGHGSGMVNDDDEDDDDEDDNAQDEHHSGQHAEQHDNNSYRHHAGMNQLGQNLVVSKGSKKWISDDDRHLGRDCGSVERCGMSGAGNEVSNAALSGAAAVACGMAGNAGAGDMGMPAFAVPPGAMEDANKLIGHNRDFLARLMNSASANHAHHNNNREEDENSSFLDVVESNNNNNAGAQMSQYHHNSAAANAASNAAAAAAAGTGGIDGAGNTPAHQSDDGQMQMNTLTHPQAFMSSFYNNANARLTGAGSSASTSASMLVEAALNSVGNMIDTESNDLKVPNENINTDSPMSAHVDSDSNRFAGSAATHPINSMDNLENELKMMKNLSSFPMQIPPLPMFPSAGNSMNACNISPNASTPTNPQSNQNNDVDVDAGSTPRPQHLSGSAADSDGFSSAHHRTPPSPQPISPGRDYGMFGAGAGGSNGTPGGPGTAGSNSSGNSAGGNSNNNNNNNISASSPLHSIQAQRRNASSVGSSYPEHELISPASSPSIPRYNFNGEMMARHKRAEQENERRQNLSGHNHLSSDDENSIIPHNSAGQDMRMKFSQSQMDLMYTKYESMANAANLKYNSQELDSPAEYRSGNSNATAAASASANDMSDLQGLDMSSRSSVSASNYHHNFQLPSSASTNIPGIGRYHHHIYDILSEREQNQQTQSQQQQHHSSAAAAAAAVAAQHQQQQEHSSQLAMQQHQSAMHNMLPDQLGEQEHDQATSVDLSRTANYVVPSPPQLPYNHPHHDIMRMASLDLTPNTNMSVSNNRSFLSSQMQHQSRESLEHHRLLSTVEQHRILAASNAAAADQHRLLVDPTAHLLMEQNNRLLGSDQSRLLGETAQNRHMARGFGAYHQVASGNYHPGVRPPVLPTANHHASNPSNYHPFPAYY